MGFLVNWIDPKSMKYLTGRFIFRVIFGLMFIQYCSDLHLEFPENRKFIKNNPLIPKAEILILAGDILPFALLDKPCEFLDIVSGSFEAVYWVPGNHEYYHYDMAEKNTVLNEKIRPNVFLVNNTAIVRKNVRLLFSTLWGNISPVNEWTISQNVSDFKVIKMNGSKFTPFHFNSLHNECKMFLAQSLKQSFAGNKIVVTHHVPTLLNYPAIYRGSNINEAFAVEMHDFIEESGADYWIYGHHHSNIPDFSIGKTRLITNQLGYVVHNEHRGFKNDAVII
ncbi:MAG: metallophosphoesterase [Bacteroidia bacterium]